MEQTIIDHFPGVVLHQDKFLPYRYNMVVMILLKNYLIYLLQFGIFKIFLCKDYDSKHIFLVK